MSKVFLENEQATIKLGSQLAESIKSCSARNLEIHLHGDLGAGKTFISRSIIQSSGWSGLVKSPTYTLCEEYDLNELLFLHIDLYRSEDIEDIDLFILVIKAHNRSGNGYTTLFFNLHEIGSC